MTRPALARWCGVAQCAAAVIDVALRIAILGLDRGMYAAAHDPGKVFFHAIVLPLVTTILVLRTPVRVLREAWARFGRPLAIVFVLFAVGIPATVASVTTVSGFCDRPPVPEDVRDDAVRARLLQQQAAGHDAIIRAWHGADNEKFKAESVKAERDYTAIISTARAKESCNFWHQASLRAKWAGLLNFFALVPAFTFIGMLLVHVVVGRVMDPRIWDILWLIVGLFVVWLPMRAYSEWWINFGVHAIYDEMKLAIAAFLLAGVLMFVLRDTGDSAKRVVGVAGVASVVSGVLALFKPELYDAAARWFAQLPPLFLGLTYLAAALMIGSVTRFVTSPILGPYDHDE